MEGPYRDLGAGFARLAGAEGLRRTPGAIRSVEDALFELLRNARDAGASNIYVASILKARRYRSLTVVDDGHGIPETHANLVFEPGVTTRHLSPVREPRPAASPPAPPHGAGLSLHHIKQAALTAEVLSASSPTAIRAVFDTRHALPEKSLQSAAKPSGSNLLSTVHRFSDATKGTSPTPPNLYHGSPAAILSRLLHDHIIQKRTKAAARLRSEASSLGLEVSLRTAQRVLAGSVAPAEEVEGLSRVESSSGRVSSGADGRDGSGGPILTLGEEEIAELSAVLRRLARASYLELSGLAAEGRPGEILIKARVYEPEEEYEDD